MWLEKQVSAKSETQQMTINKLYEKKDVTFLGNSSIYCQKNCVSIFIY